MKEAPGNGVTASRPSSVADASRSDARRSTTDGSGDASRRAAGYAPLDEVEVRPAFGVGVTV